MQIMESHLLGILILVHRVISLTDVIGLLTMMLMFHLWAFGGGKEFKI
jgi:hypothetical protein